MAARRHDRSAPPAVPPGGRERLDGLLRPWFQRLFEPVDVASLAAFRVAFGGLMFLHMLGYLTKGWLHTHYLAPAFYFKYPGFAWLPALPKEALPAFFWALAGLAAMIALGIFSRVACALFALGFGYVLLLDAASYQNHLYLICLLAFLLAVVPAHRTLSLTTRSGQRTDWAPTWALWLLRFQLAVPYVLGGLAKLNYDWLVRAQPVAIWMSEAPPGRFRAAFLDERWAAYGIAWGGLLYDLLVVPALLWRRTRLLAVAVTLAFHLSNSRLFSIGVFPSLMIAATMLFFPPDWPRRLRLMRRPRRPQPGAAPAGGGMGRRAPPAAGNRHAAPRGRYGRRAVLAFLGVWVAVQLLLPFRHLLYPGAVDWTEEGHRFAWRMKLRDKRGTLRFVAVDRRRREVHPLTGVEAVLTPNQRHMMLHDPNMIRQFARHVAQGLASTGYGPVEVRAITSISLNGRPPRPMIDPEVDLAAQPHRWGPAPWIARAP